MLRIVFVILLLFLSHVVKSQLTTTVQDPATLVQNILLGDNNVNIFNISFQGSPSAIGSFTNPNTNLGIDAGIVMTTGTILGTAGPIGPNSVPNAGLDNKQPGYQLLTNIVGRQTFNASVLSFDFQTCSDSIEFRYVFGSEEYAEFVGSKFNDVFGFFISGPGFAGQQNIARLPNGAPVAINSVNNGNLNPYSPQIPITGPSNPQYYIDNGKGGLPPQNKGNYIQYDGFTTVLTARAKVECGATYHLIMAIADVGDGLYDSGVFLEAQSFKAVAPIKTSYTLSSQAFDEPNALVRACSDATIRFDRTVCKMHMPVSINVMNSGSAIPGVDYQVLPNNVTISANMSYTEFILKPIYNGQPEPDKTVVLVFSYTDNCGDQHQDTLNFILRDMKPLNISLSDQWLTCPGDEINLTPSITGGGGNYQYLWSTGATTKTISVNPEITSNYALTVTDECSNDTISKTITVNVPTSSPIVLTGSPDEENICPYVPTTFFVNASGGFGGYSYLWSNNFGETFGTDSVQKVLPEKTTIYSVTVTDVCGQKENYSLTYTVLSPPLIVELNSGIEICPGDSIELISTVTGGYGTYYYNWPHSTEKTPNVWVNPWFTTTYELIVSDDCQTFSVSEKTEVVVIKPNANFEPTSSVLFNNIPITFHNLTQNANSYVWDFGDSQSSTVVHPNHVFDDPGIYVITLIATDDKGCIDSIKKNITILEEYYIYIPNTFTPNDDRTNQFFSVQTVNIAELQIDIFDRWGNVIYNSDDLYFQWDGTQNGIIVSDGLYTYKVRYIATNGTQKELVGHVNLLH